MTGARRISALLIMLIGVIAVSTSVLAQDATKTPSEKTKEALDKVTNAPDSIGKTLQGLRDAAKDKLRQSLGKQNKAESKESSKIEQVDLKVPKRAPENAAASPAVNVNARDPFRPMSLRAKVNSRARENLSPLERLDLSQLKVVGIIWDIKEPRAMVEDTAGLGYVVKVGTPIGTNDGVVKAIRRNELVVEETTADIYGARKKRDVNMMMATE